MVGTSNKSVPGMAIEYIEQVGLVSIDLGASIKCCMLHDSYWAIGRRDFGGSRWI